MINTKTYKFTFGKYIGEPYNKIKSLYPEYILWCHNNVEYFKLDTKELENITKEVYKKKEQYIDIMLKKHRNKQLRKYIED